MKVSQDGGEEYKAGDTGPLGARVSQRLHIPGASSTQCSMHTPEDGELCCLRRWARQSPQWAARGGGGQLLLSMWR